MLLLVIANYDRMILLCSSTTCCVSAHGLFGGSTLCGVTKQTSLAYLRIIDPLHHRSSICVQLLIPIDHEHTDLHVPIVHDEWHLNLPFTGQIKLAARPLSYAQDLIEVSTWCLSLSSSTMTVPSWPAPLFLNRPSLKQSFHSLLISGCQRNVEE